MSAPVGRGNGVHEAHDAGIERCTPAHRHVHLAVTGDLGELAIHRHLLGEFVGAMQIDEAADRLGIASQLLDKIGQATRRHQFLRRDRLAASVGQGELDFRHEEARLLHALTNLGVADRCVGIEHVGIGPETHPRASSLRRHLAHDLERVASPEAPSSVGVACLTVPELQPVGAAIAVDLDLHLRRQRVDHRSAHAVQTSRRAVRAIAELAPGMQLGEHHFQRRHITFLDIDGNAAAPVGDLVGTVAVKSDLDQLAVPRSGLIHGVVDHLPQQVGEPARASAADVHAGPLADRFEPFQHLDGVGVVGARSRRCGRRFRSAGAVVGCGVHGVCPHANRAHANRS